MLWNDSTLDGQVVNACQLATDLANLEGGDACLIGERGVTLR